jgi:glycosyltransferase involved in cell wall biosynthesis
MPLADHALRPVSTARGRVNLGYTFFESSLEPSAVWNAKKYDTVFVGSTWCQRRCALAGITNTKVLIQGVNSDLFPRHPLRPPDGKLRIFSGGKFEFRKGQDLVIAAFRDFLRTRPDAHLVCAWHNPWPHLVGTMTASKAITCPPLITANQQAFLRQLMEANGVPAENYTLLPKLTASQLSAEMANTDFGLFPNRCEGGTNLVLMEYLASGRSAVANLATGHGDLADSAIIPIPSTIDSACWAVQKVEDILGAMERAGHEDGRIPPEGARRQWDWDDAAQIVVETALTHLSQS